MKKKKFPYNVLRSCDAEPRTVFVKSDKPPPPGQKPKGFIFRYVRILIFYVTPALKTLMIEYRMHNYRNSQTGVEELRVILPAMSLKDKPTSVSVPEFKAKIERMFCPTSVKKIMKALRDNIPNTKKQEK